VVVITSHSGDGLEETRNFQPLQLAMTMMECTCITYNLTMLLIVLVSICVFGFETVIKCIANTLKISTCFSMKMIYPHS